MRQTGAVRFKNKNDIENWILDSAALISKNQISSDVSTPIPTRPREVIAHRPPGYGRSCIAKNLGYLFDLKGVGVSPYNTPKDTIYETGLFHLHNAVYETYAQRLVKKKLHLFSVFETVETIAIIRLPFNYKTFSKNRISLPAAILVREPSVRIELQTFNENAQNTPYDIFNVEESLRKVGISSCTPDNVAHFDISNKVIQGHFGRDKKAFSKSQLVNWQKFIENNDLLLPLDVDLLNLQLAYDTLDKKIKIIDFEHFCRRDKFNIPYALKIESNKLTDISLLLDSPSKYESINRFSCSWRDLLVPYESDVVHDKYMTKKYGKKSLIHYFSMENHLSPYFSRSIHYALKFDKKFFSLL